VYDSTLRTKAALEVPWFAHSDAFNLKTTRQQRNEMTVSIFLGQRQNCNYNDFDTDSSDLLQVRGFQVKALSFEVAKHRFDLHTTSVVVNRCSD